ncbi:MAG: glycoside hydrolase domain-containing protein [Gemmatimonadaceae bacterium]
MPRLARTLFTGLTIAAAAGCGDGTRASVADVSAGIAEFAAAATGQHAVVADEVKNGYLGFDTGTYPGDKAMLAWRTGGAPYEWTGYYLPSPCHPDEGWSGKREALTSMGYGLAVIYVGQQTWGRMPGAPHLVPVQTSHRVKARVGNGSKRRTVWKTVMRTVMRRAPAPAPDATCNADFVSPARGVRDGVDAIARTSQDGFANGTTIFLDLERMDVLPQVMREYYKTWVRTVLDDGRYRPGIYVHTFNANVVYSDVKSVYRSVGEKHEPPFWVAKSAGFDITKLPSEVGHAFAAVWQGVLDVEQTWNGHKIPIDVNVSASKNPSSERPVLRTTD